MMRIPILSLCAFALAMTNRVDAHQYSFLLQNPIQMEQGPDEFSEVNFSIFLDPLKTNWIAWSQAAVSTEDSQGEAMVDPIVPNNYGIDDYMEIRLTSPDGTVSPTYELDRNDANNVSYGPQAFVFGKEESNPRVVRTDASGKPTFFNESGVADPFIREGGKGYYNVSITFKNEFGDARGTGDVFLLMDVHEDFVPEPPSFQNRVGLEQLPYLSWGDNGGHGSSSGRSSGFSPGDTNGNNDGGGGNNNSPPDFPNNPNIPSIPEIPDTPVTPVVPEPGTLLLTAMGLSALAGRLRRRPL